MRSKIEQAFFDFGVALFFRRLKRLHPSSWPNLSREQVKATAMEGLAARFDQIWPAEKETTQEAEQ
jgi:hypothetical protein